MRQYGRTDAPLRELRPDLTCRSTSSRRTRTSSETSRKKVPDLETPVLIACSDGRTYSIDALEQCVSSSHPCNYWFKASVDAFAVTFKVDTDAT